MFQEPNRSFSHKFRQLGRLNLKTRNGANDKEHAHRPSPLQNTRDTDFRIVHTPDRLVSPRPIPTVEECREEIKRWHREAAERGRVDGGGEDDDDDVEFSLTPTVSRKTSTRECRRLAGEWVIQSTRRGGSPEVPGAGDGEDWDREMARGLGVLDLEDEGRVDKKEAASTSGRNKTKELDYGAFPIFQPPPEHIPREIDAVNKKIKTPPLQIHRALGGFLSPDETEKAYTVLRKSLDKRKPPLASEYIFDSDCDTPTANQSPPKPPPNPLNQTLYARGLCPSCLHPRSKIEALRCGRCHAHLSAYSAKPIKNIPKEPSHTHRPTTPLSTAPPTKSPHAETETDTGTDTEGTKNLVRRRHRHPYQSVALPR
ncbi:hypothetical protein B0T18DRAFT_444399 [Schizothecium vesticola]|uniref:Uncharacterized protein n=1 Tax=Schizothecium vesticola TaxID=314040 RepID=A0AA40F6S6_9PEZI|nr:hypothetical protein B0T18DRAFT_444399 [Schizothecium vesticola]